MVREAKPGTNVSFAGKIRGNSYRFNNLEVHYEPLPTPLTPAMMNSPGSYSLPKEARKLLPKLPAPLIYLDGSSGVVKVDGPNFSASVKLYRSTPGIYTIVTWVRRSFEEPAIPVTAVCVKAL